MSLSRDVSKKVLVVALSDEDKSMFMGSLVYRTGLDLELLKQLEKAQKTRYDQIIPYMRDVQLQPYFRTAKHRCAFVEGTDTAEVVIILLDITMSTSDALGTLRFEEIKKAVSGGASAVVIVDKMQDANWAPQPYEDLVTNVEAAFKKEYGDAKEICSVPASSVNGDNFLDLSSKSHWYSQQDASSGGVKLPCTVIEAIDW